MRSACAPVRAARGPLPFQKLRQRTIAHVATSRAPSSAATTQLPTSQVVAKAEAAHGPVAVTALSFGVLAVLAGTGDLAASAATAWSAALALAFGGLLNRVNRKAVALPQTRESFLAPSNIEIDGNKASYATSSEVDALQLKLELTTSQLTAQASQIQELTRELEVLKCSKAATTYAFQSSLRNCKEREAEISALRYRLLKLKRDPTAFDSEWDPATEHELGKIIRDAHVQHLERERVRLMLELGHHKSGCQ